MQTGGSSADPVVLTAVLVATLVEKFMAAGVKFINSAQINGWIKFRIKFRVQSPL